MGDGPLYILRECVLGIKRCVDTLVFLVRWGCGVDGLFYFIWGIRCSFETYHLGEMRAEEEKRDSVH